MPITSIETDSEALTVTIVADFTVPVRRLWDAYLDPRQIERFWGPPGWPATFTRHDGVPEGLSKYHMTGPDGESSGGYWKWEEVEAPRRFVVRDGFVGDDGEPNTHMPDMRMEFDFSETALGSRLTAVTRFNSLAELEQLSAMGMVEGTTAAMGQIDAVVADLEAFTAGRGTDLQLIGSTQARVSRVIRGSAAEVWHAYTEPDLLRRWQLGPDGWRMVVCEVGTKHGETNRVEWQNDATDDRFGFVGMVMEITPGSRLVTTETMVTADNPTGEGQPETLNELTLTPVEGGTLLSCLITYPSTELREQILATGMVDGMEASYARLEREVLGA